MKRNRSGWNKPPLSALDCAVVTRNDIMEGKARRDSIPVVPRTIHIKGVIGNDTNSKDGVMFQELVVRAAYFSASKWLVRVFSFALRPGRTAAVCRRARPCHREAFHRHCGRLVDARGDSLDHLRCWSDSWPSKTGVDPAPRNMPPNLRSYWLDRTRGCCFGFAVRKRCYPQGPQLNP